MRENAECRYRELVWNVNCLDVVTMGGKERWKTIEENETTLRRIVIGVTYPHQFLFVAIVNNRSNLIQLKKSEGIFKTNQAWSVKRPFFYIKVLTPIFNQAYRYFSVS